MTLFESGLWRDDAIVCEPFPFSTVGYREGPLQLEQPSMPRTRIEPENITLGEGLKIEGSLCNIQLPEFPTDRPWLPQKALVILEKLRKGPVSEKELVTLMDLVAEQATTHFQLQLGKFVASTFFGRVVDVSDTRVGLLKKIQSRVFTEEIFVWRAGFPSFSGRT